MTGSSVPELSFDQVRIGEQFYRHRFMFLGVKEYESAAAEGNLVSSYEEPRGKRSWEPITGGSTFELLIPHVCSK